MKKLLTVLLVATCLPVQAYAQDAVCGALEKHAPDVGVAHQVDEDVNLTKDNMVPDVVKVPLTVDLAQRIASLNGAATQLEAPFGMVEIHKDGRVTYNGEDFTSSVKTLCGQSHTIKTVTEVSDNDILNQKKILNTAPVINRVPAPPPPESELTEVKTDKPEKAISISMKPSLLEEEPVRPAVSKKEIIEQPPKRAIEVVKDDNEFTMKSRGIISKASGDMVEVQPAVAIPPTGELPEPPEVKFSREPDRVILSDMIEGGDYREIYTNE